MRTNKGMRIALIAVVVALVATSCGGGGDESVDETVPGDTTGTTSVGGTTPASSTTTTALTTSGSPTTTEDVPREWTNAAVSVWQQFLADQGNTIDIDGFFGQQTQTATLDFQRRNGIPETGVADRLTLDTAGAALRDAVFAEMTIITTTTTTERTPQAGDPAVTIACPSAETEIQAQYRATFEHTESYTSFARISMDYGDGKTFGSRIESTGITGAFWHVYDTPGTFTVTVTITDGDGIAGSASCTLVWQPA